MASDRLKAARDVLDVLDPYGAPHVAKPEKGETDIQRQQREINERAREEERAAKCEALDKALRRWLDAARSESTGPKRKRSWFKGEVD